MYRWYTRENKKISSGIVPLIKIVSLYNYGLFIQLVYDFQKGEGNFSLLSYTETDEHSDELHIQAFRELGFELPSRTYISDA